MEYAKFAICEHRRLGGPEKNRWFFKVAILCMCLIHSITKPGPVALQVIRVKWSLHAREEIVFELLHHLRGNAARTLLEEIRKSTREMMEEQEAVRGRLFTIQDVMQSTVRAWLQVCTIQEKKMDAHLQFLSQLWTYLPRLF